jgi:3-oxoacyl-[acyl-carrier-protein] synthase-1
MSDVAVVQVGARTAVGLDARQTGFMLRLGVPAMAEAPLANEKGEPITMAFVPTIDGDVVGAERLLSLAREPFEEAVDPIRDLNAEVFVAVDEACPEGPLATRLIEGMIGKVMPSARVRVEARGEAAPGAMLPDAIQKLKARRADVVVLGGVHSDYDPRVIAALESQKRLFSKKNLDSLIPGEAAAFFVLMRTGEASRHRLTPLCRVLGVGAGRERARPDNDESAYEATGLTAAVRQATAPLAESGQTAGWFLTDLTFEMRRQYEWQSAWVRSQKILGNPYIIDSPAQRIGYLGAAAIPLFVAMTAMGWRYGYAPSPVALAVAGSDGGDRAALALGKA